MLQIFSDLPANADDVDLASDDDDDDDDDDTGIHG